MISSCSDTWTLPSQRQQVANVSPLEVLRQDMQYRCSLCGDLDSSDTHVCVE